MPDPEYLPSASVQQTAQTPLGSLYKVIDSGLDDVAIYNSLVGAACVGYMAQIVTVHLLV